MVICRLYRSICKISNQSISSRVADINMTKENKYGNEMKNTWEIVELLMCKEYWLLFHTEHSELFTLFVSLFSGY